MTYAADTGVSVGRSREELERTLMRYGATAFGYAYETEGDQAKAVVQFRAQGRFVRFVLPLPGREEFKLTPTGKWRRDGDAIDKAWEQAQRQRWRALNLVVKAKLEAVEAGITTFDEEFLAHVLLPDGTTVGEFMTPQVELAYEQGEMPKMLPEHT